jgi:hypothetical protein
MRKWALCQRQNQACIGIASLDVAHLTKSFNNVYITPIGAKVTDTSPTHFSFLTVGNGVKLPGKTRTTVGIWPAVSYQFRRLLGDKRTTCQELNLRDVLIKMSRVFHTIMEKTRLNSIALKSNRFASRHFHSSSLCSTKACFCTPIN